MESLRNFHPSTSRQHLKVVWEYFSLSISGGTETNTNTVFTEECQIMSGGLMEKAWNKKTESNRKAYRQLTKKAIKGVRQEEKELCKHPLACSDHSRIVVQPSTRDISSQKVMWYMVEQSSNLEITTLPFNIISRTISSSFTDSMRWALLQGSEDSQLILRFLQPRSPLAMQLSASRLWRIWLTPARASSDCVSLIYWYCISVVLFLWLNSWVIIAATAAIRIKLEC